MAFRLPLNSLGYMMKENYINLLAIIVINLRSDMLDQFVNFIHSNCEIEDQLNDTNDPFKWQDLYYLQLRNCIENRGKNNDENQPNVEFSH